MQKATTIAQGIADRFNNDGDRWHDADGARLVDVVDAARAKVEHYGSARVCVFEDGSGIAMCGGAWDVVAIVEPTVWRSVEQDGTVNRNGWTLGGSLA